jgi:hypothetical protein
LPDYVAVGFDFDDTVVELIGDEIVAGLVELMMLLCAQLHCRDREANDE